MLAECQHVRIAWIAVFELGGDEELGVAAIGLGVKFILRPERLPVCRVKHERSIEQSFRFLSLAGVHQGRAERGEYNRIHRPTVRLRDSLARSVAR